MLDRLDTDYIDLFLLHQQIGDYLGAWKDMEKSVREGKVRAIGLSNFESERLEEVLETSQIKPAVLQVECHPYYQQNDLKEWIAAYDIKVESWYPLEHADAGLLNEPLFVKLSRNNYKFETQDDTGTGSNYKGMVVYDLAVLYLTALPAIAHGSLILKNIGDGAVDGIMKIYAQSRKQVFIAFDKQAAYMPDTQKILADNTVLKLSDGNCKLYGETWNKEVSQK